MGHGGSRPGAGRKPGSRNKRPDEPAQAIDGIEDPEEFLLALMKATSVDIKQRQKAATDLMRMRAQKARVGLDTETPGKKARAAQAARDAHVGTLWDGLLN